MPLTIVEVAEDVDQELRGAVVAVSDFDGVLEGHRRFLATAAEIAAKLAAPLVAASTQSHPATERLTSLDQQARLLEDLGVENLYVSRLHRRPERAQLAACRRDPASAWLGARQVFVDADGSNVAAAERVRRALKAGRPELAQHILGRPFAMEGLVVE